MTKNPKGNNSTVMVLQKIEIEDNIPLPKYTKMPLRNDLATDIEKMEPMQSRLIDQEFTDKNLNALRTRIHAIQKRLKLEDRKYTVNFDPITEAQHQSDKKVVVKMRVWRVQ
jgi:hypothetical protein